MRPKAVVTTKDYSLQVREESNEIIQIKLERIWYIGEIYKTAKVLNVAYSS